MGSGKDAVRRYRRAVGFATADWAKYRAALRLMDAGGKCGQFDAQVDGFVELAKLDPANAQNHACRRFPASRPSSSMRVIGGLEKAASGPDLTKDSAAVVKELLANIYLAKGDTANVARMVAAGRGRSRAAAAARTSTTMPVKFSERSDRAGRGTHFRIAYHNMNTRNYWLKHSPIYRNQKRDEVLAKGAGRFFEDWNSQRRKIEGIDGVAVLICMDPLRIEIGATSETAEKLFTAADRDELLRHLTDAVHDHQFDAALTSTASFILKRIGEHALKDAPAVFADPGDATRIIFLCDSSGSMLNKMATLKDQVQKAVSAPGAEPVLQHHLLPG